MVKDYNGKVRVVYKHFVVHPDTAMPAHLAACAADKQGKFHDFKSAFWEKGFGAYAQTRDPSAMKGDALLTIAKEAGLDVGKLKAEMNGEDCKALIDRNMKTLSNFRVSGTPSFFVNGKFTMFSGEGPFKAQIDAELAEAEKSGIPATEYYQRVVLDKGSKTFRSKADAKADKGDSAATDPAASKEPQEK